MILKALWALNKYFFRYKYRLFLGVVFIAVSNILAIYPATVIREALDEVIDGVQVLSLFSGSALHKDLMGELGKILFLFSLLIIGMALLKGVFMFLMRQTIIVMSRLIEFDMKNEIFHHYQQLSLSFYKRHNTGDLMNRISEDVSRVRMYVGPAIMYTINLFVLFLMVITAMLRVHPKLTFFVLLPLPILSIAVYFVNNTILQKSEKVQEQLSTLSSFVQETFSGIRILKAYTRIVTMGLRFAEDADEYKMRNLDLVLYNAIFFPLIMLLIGVSTIIVILMGGHEVHNGTISPGVIAEFIIYVNMLTWPVASIGWVTAIIQRATASQKRINEFMQIEPEIYFTEQGCRDLDGTLCFQNVSFVYPDTGIEALSNISFCVPKGKTLGIIGHTGSGKTTIAQLILRYYNPTGGQIMIDDKEIATFHLPSFRNHIGYVPQDVFLFSDTIEKNILFGLADSKDNGNLNAKVVKAATDAFVHHNIMNFTEQYQTRIGERGITLSGGQKQRISIARAIIRDPQILIFDDCLSAVDTETEEKILQNLLSIMHGKTSILISHRISSLKFADHIIVLERGKIVEEGSHQALLAKKGVYFNLYQQQIKEDMINLSE